MKKLSQSDIKSAKAAATSFFIFGILTGSIKLSSLLFVASMTRFGVDRERASFPFFLCYTINLASGPLTGYLGGKFGLKNVILAGCLLSTFGIGGCFFAENIETITFFWGVVYAFGFGLGVALLPNVLSLHFSSHLDKAFGITIGSESIACFLLLLLTKYLLKTYGLSGTFLILSGVAMHSVPAALLIQIPNRNKVQNEVSPRKYVGDGQKENPNSLSGEFEQKTNKDECKGQSQVSSRECVVKYVGDDQKENFTSLSGELEQKTNQNECNGNKVPTTAISTKQKLDTKSSFHGFRVFLNLTYVVIVLILSLFVFIMTTTTTILVDVIRDHDVSLDDSVYVFTGFQVADGIGRFTLGFVTDRGYLSKSTFLAVCLFATGLILVALIWTKGLVGMVIIVFGLGIFNGGMTMVTAGLVMQYVEKDYFSIAIPSSFLFYTPLSFIQGPLIGYFRDKLKSYNGLLYIVIAICCVSGIGSLMVPSLERWRQKRKMGSKI